MESHLMCPSEELQAVSWLPQKHVLSWFLQVVGQAASTHHSEKCTGDLGEQLVSGAEATPPCNMYSAWISEGGECGVRPADE